VDGAPLTFETILCVSWGAEGDAEGAVVGDDIGEDLGGDVARSGR
jgi:hypothetical protein